MMWLAVPLTASSRNLLSFGSRHSVISVVILTISASRTRAAKNSSRSSSVTYLLNFGRRSTSSSSAMVAADTNSWPRSAAKSNACRGTERGRKTELTATLVSMTARISFAMQQRLQEFRRQAACFGPGTDFVHDVFERPSGTSSKFAESESEQKFEFLPLLGRSFRVDAGRIRIDFNGNCCCSHNASRKKETASFPFSEYFVQAIQFEAGDGASSLPSYKASSSCSRAISIANAGFGETFAADRMTLLQLLQAHFENSKLFPRFLVIGRIRNHSAISTSPLRRLLGRHVRRHGLYPYSVSRRRARSNNCGSSANSGNQSG